MSQHAQQVTKQAIDHEVRLWNGFKEQILRDFPDLDDPQTLFDSLDGATELVDKINILAQFLKEEELRVSSLHVLASQYKDKAKRAEERAETIREKIRLAMKAADIQIIKRPQGPIYRQTYSARLSKKNIDVDLLPKKYTVQDSVTVPLWCQ